MTWLQTQLETHKELEAPLSFWKWASLCAISAIAKDNIWFHKQIYNVYPNIYVMLHADSGMKKGAPIGMANRLVKTVNNTKIIEGRSSIQAILKDMGQAKTEPGGHIVTTHSVFICSSELTSSIVSDPVAMDILTDLFDRQWRVGEWRSLLKMESFSLTNPVVTMLAGTNEAHSEEFFSKKDLQGGYFARTFIVYEKETQTVNSLMFPLKNPPNDKEAAEYLKKIALLRGEFKMEDSERHFFNDWYVELKKSLKDHDIKDPTGTLNRFDDSVLKVAMLISLGHAPELVITRAALEEAIKDCEKLVGNVRRTTGGRGKNNYAPHITMLMHDLVERNTHSISRKMLLDKYCIHANQKEWDDILGTLESAGQITSENLGNQLIYKMPDEKVKGWQDYFAGKRK